MPTEEEDAQYEAEYIQQIARGLANTTLLDDAALFAANDPNRPAQVIPGTKLVNRPAEHYITGMPWSDMSPVDYANLAEMEFPLADIAVSELPTLSTGQIASRRFGAGVITSQRAALSGIDDWLVGCRNAPEGEHMRVLADTATQFVNKLIGSYRPADDAGATVMIYYCWVDTFVFIAISADGNIQEWQFYVHVDGVQ